MSLPRIDEFLPGVVVFGDALAPSRDEVGAAPRAPELREALTGVEGFAGMSRRAESMTRLTTVAADVADSLGRRLDDLDSTPEPRSAAQRYFRLRTADLPPDHRLWYFTTTVARVAEDLFDAPVAGSDLLRIGEAAVTVLDMMTRPPGPVIEYISSARPLPERPIEEVWLRRWILGHQLHAMFNVHAAHALTDAIDALRSGRPHGAATALDAATRIVEGFAGARAYALAVPADFYQEVLRPSMLPPLTEAPLTGRMHVEYQGYRQRLADLVDLLPQPSAGLAAAQPRLAFSRERLLEADLIEAERHVTSVEPLVRDSRSLIQSGRSVDNAVGSLRHIRHRRAARIAGFVRFPDRVASIGAVPSGAGGEPPDAAR